MAAEHSLDIVSRIDLQEVSNAVNQAMKEVSQRYDFKGSRSSIELDKADGEMTLVSDDEQKLKSLTDILESKFVRRKLSLKSLSYGKVEQASGNTVRQSVKLQQGIPLEKAKALVKMVKNTKLKVQAEIQKDQVRVKGKKIDDLQAIITLLKEETFDYHMEFINFR
jgi:uncharacterized protein YajQ (UPF0234 family)